MGIVWPTSNLKKRHLRGRFAGYALCGLGRVGLVIFTDTVGKSTCGSCIAIYRTSVVDAPVPPIDLSRRLYCDADCPATIWERTSTDQMFPLSIAGERLALDPDEVPEFEAVEQMYGPLTLVDELDALWRYVRHLNNRVGSI